MKKIVLILFILIIGSVFASDDMFHSNYGEPEIEWNVEDLGEITVNKQELKALGCTETSASRIYNKHNGKTATESNKQAYHADKKTCSLTEEEQEGIIDLEKDRNKPTKVKAPWFCAPGLIFIVSIFGLVAFRRD